MSKGDKLEQYHAAYAEGMDGRDHDTEDGPCGSDSSAGLSRLPAHTMDMHMVAIPLRCRDSVRRYAEDYARRAVAAERERWQQAAKAVIESHDAALAYVYERLRSQGVRGITIHDTAAAEIRAVNALRELVQPNAKLSGAAGLPDDSA